MSVNLHVGDGDGDEIADLVAAHEIDVLSVQELTPESARVLESGTLPDSLPFSRVRARMGSAGIALYADRRLRGTGVPPFVAGLPGVSARLMLEGEPIDVFAVHPPPPLGESSVRDLESYLDAIPPADPEAPPRILAGDFNATLDHAKLRRLLDDGYRDAADSLGSGLIPTWPSRRWPPPMTIDHVIADRRLVVLDYEVVDIEGSDHRAVISTLAYADQEP